MTDERRVAIVKSPGRADLFAIAIRELGYVPVLVSPYRYEAVENADAALASALDSGPDWIAVTSPHAAPHLAPLAPEIVGVPVAAVGPGTASSLISVGIQPELIGDGGGAALARALLDAGVEDGDLVVHPGAENVRPELHDILTAVGVEVVPVAVYRMELDEVGARSATGDFAGIVVGSPRLVDRALEYFPGHPCVIAIGPTTAQAMRDHGWEPAAVAARPVPEEVARALAAVLGDDAA